MEKQLLISGGNLVSEGGGYRDLIQLVEYELTEALTNAEPLANARLEKDGNYEHDPKLNYFGVNASQALSIWKKKG